MKKLEGHVIRILDEYTLLIDLGQSDGLRENDSVKVVEHGDSIEDVDGNSLGTFDFVKADLVVTDLQYEFAVIRDISHRSSSSFYDTIAQMTKNFGSIGFGGETIEEKSKLDVRKDQVEQMTKTELSSKIIKKGDSVTIVIDR